MRIAQTLRDMGNVRIEEEKKNFHLTIFYLG
jgi:hypothetical protein